jgi:hypothetical protein
MKSRFNLFIWFGFLIIVASVASYIPDFRGVCQHARTLKPEWGSLSVRPERINRANGPKGL